MAKKLQLKSLLDVSLRDTIYIIDISLVTVTEGKLTSIIEEANNYKIKIDTVSYDILVPKSLEGVEGFEVSNKGITITLNKDSIEKFLNVYIDRKIKNKATSILEKEEEIKILTEEIKLLNSQKK